MTQPLTLSLEGKRLQKIVTAPIGHREYVSYNRSFLEQYVPNETYYLDKKVREDLFHKGFLEKRIGDFEERFLLDLSWNSSRLEDNRYSFDEAKKILEGELKKEDEDAIMLLNHKEAILFLKNLGEKVSPSSETVCFLHKLLSNRLLGNEKSCGNMRSIPVKISGSVYLPIGIPSILEECFKKIIQIVQEVKDPFEQAFFLMVHIPYLQAFEDVNKRTSRLAMNIPFFMKDLCPFSFIDVPLDEYVQGLLGVYELNDITLLREVFVWGYIRSCQRYGVGVNVSNPSPFLLKYRTLTKNLVNEIVKKRIGLEKIDLFIKEKIKDLPEEEKEEFSLFIKESLDGLHLYNIAWFGLVPEDYQRWKSEK